MEFLAWLDAAADHAAANHKKETENHADGRQ
jgi:hypothetical protein